MSVCGPYLSEKGAAWAVALPAYCGAGMMTVHQME